VVKYYAALLVAMGLNATANLLLKQGMKRVEAGGGILADGAVQAMLKVVGSPFLLFGLVFFALNVFIYMFALQKIPICIAYPIMVMTGFAIIAVVSGVFMKETLNAVQWVGVALVLIGAVTIASQMTE
jgi:multidrug transporter EmrE-like cation transporter